MDVDLVNLVKGKGKKGKGKDGRGKRAKARGRLRKAKVKVRNGGASTATGKDTSRPTVLRRSSTTRRRVTSKSSSSIDNVMPVTMAPTAREHESSDELWIFAFAVGGSLGSGIGVPSELVELMVDSGADVRTTCIHARARLKRFELSSGRLRKCSPSV